jgi:hypothetical protein
MMKKWLPGLLILLFLGWASYRFFFTRDITKATATNSMALDWNELDATTGSKVTETPETIKVTPPAPSGEQESTVSPDNAVVKTSPTAEGKDQFQEFDIIEGKWIGQVEGIIGKKNFPRYLAMRKRNESEKLVAYKAYHEYLKQKYGDNYSYNISEDQNVAEKKINQRYLQMLLRLIGEEKFQQYLKARDQINEENRRDNKEFIQIEF